MGIREGITTDVFSSWQALYSGLNPGTGPSEATAARAQEVITGLMQEGIRDPKEVVRQLEAILKADQAGAGIRTGASILGGRGLEGNLKNFLIALSTPALDAKLAVSDDVSANREGFSTVGTTIEVAYRALKESLGISPPEPEERVAHLVDVIANQSYVPAAERPGSIQEAEKLFESLNQKEIEETEAFEALQLERLPAEMRNEYLLARAKVIDLYTDEKVKLDAWLKKAAEIGYPDTAGIKKAELALDQAILADESLEAQGIGPAEFQILLKRQEYKAAQASGDTDQISFRRSLAYGQERMYVTEVLSHKITELKKAGHKKREWRAIEKLGVKALDLYDRLIEGKELLPTDYEDLAQIRAVAFPFELDADEVSQQIRRKLDGLERAWTEFDAHSKKFNQTMAPLSVEINKAAEKVSMGRDTIDHEFQLKRLDAEFQRLKAHVEGQGKTLRPYDIQMFEERVAAYKKSYQKYRKFWDGIYSGDDITARENKRSGLEKQALFDLAFGAQWQLFEMYKDYEVKDESGAPVVPSCLSFSFVNNLRVMAEGYDSGRLNSNNIAQYFKGLYFHIKDAVDELGLTIPYMNFRFGGRDFLDLAAIDNLAAEVGAGSLGEVGAKTFIHGAANLAYLVMEQPPHPDIAMASGAEAVFNWDVLKHLDHSRNPVFFRANHTGIKEFWIMLIASVMGIHLPQLAQGAMAKIPIFGGYLSKRITLLMREAGASDASRKLYDFLMRAMAVLMYPAGARLVSPGGGAAYVGYRHHPSMVLGRRIITDRITAGQDMRILGNYARDTQGASRVLLMNLVQDAGRFMPESTWFLTGGFGEMVLGNLGPDTMLNFVAGEYPTHLAFGTAMSSNGLLTVDEWKKLMPAEFVHPDGTAYSTKAAEYKCLQLNEATLKAAMRFDAAQIDLEKPLPETPEQVERQQQLADMDNKQAIRESVEPMTRHLKDRIARIGKARTPAHLAGLPADLKGVAQALASEEFNGIPKAEREKRILQKPSKELLSRMSRHVSETRARDLLKKTFTFAKGPLSRDEKDNAKGVLEPQTMPYMIEAVQRGARQAEEGGVMAFDLDKVMWDHYFPVSGHQLITLLSSEIHHYLPDFMGQSSPDSAERALIHLVTSANLDEVINIDPLWLAFVIGYAEKKGRPPVFFSSTMAPRLQALALNMNESPLVRRFFEVLFSKPGITPEEAQRNLSPERLVQDYRDGNVRIITREVIAEHIKVLLGRLQNNEYSLEGFTQAEKIDIKSILATNGDVHLKLRSLVPYDVIVDDRKENAAESAKHKGVTVVNPEPHAAPEMGNLYWITDTESHDKQRANQGRSGKALEAMRLMQSSEGRDRLIRIPRYHKVSPVKGVYDGRVRISYSREAARQSYEGPIKQANDLALAVRQEMIFRAQELDEARGQARRNLAKYYLSLEGRDDVSASQLEMARLLVDPTVAKKNDKGKYPELKSDAEIEALKAPLRTLPDSEEKAQAFRDIQAASDHALTDLLAEVSPRAERGGKDPISMAMRYWGKTIKFFKDKVLPFVGALGLSFNHVLGDLLKGRLNFKSLSNALKMALDGDTHLLRKLGGEMGNKDVIKFATEEDRAEAYGVALQTAFNVFVQSYIDKIDLSAHIGPDETEEGLREELKQRAQQIGHEVKKGVYHLMMALKHGTLAKDHFLNAWSDLKDLFDSPLGEASQSAVKSFLSETVLGSYVRFFDNLLTKTLSEDSHLNRNGLVMKAFIGGLSQAFGDHPLAGEVLKFLDAKLEHRGFAGVVGEMMGAFKRAQDLARPEIKSAASEIVEQIESDDWGRALQMAALNAGRYRLMDRHKDGEAASKQVDRMFESASFMLAAKRRPAQVRKIQRKVSHMRRVVREHVLDKGQIPGIAGLNPWQAMQGYNGNGSGGPPTTSFTR